MTEVERIRELLRDAGYESRPSSNADEYIVDGTDQLSPPILVLNEQAVEERLQVLEPESVLAFGEDEDRRRGALNLFVQGIESILSTRIVRRVGYSATGPIDDTSRRPQDSGQAVMDSPEVLGWVQRDSNP